MIHGHCIRCGKITQGRHIRPYCAPVWLCSKHRAELKAIVEAFLNGESCETTNASGSKT